MAIDVIKGSIRAEFSTLRYSQVWEDADVMLAALQPVKSSILISIASAGDNALALLLTDPQQVIAIDINPAQIALTHLKVAAIATLGHKDCLAFLGVTPSNSRTDFFNECQAQMPGTAIRYWQDRQGDIDRGVIHIGKFERYFSLFRRFVLPIIHSKKTVEAMLAASDLPTQERVYADRWNNRRWRWLFRIFFGKFLLGRLGRDPAFFNYVEEGSVGNHFLMRAKRALTQLPVANNYFIEYILTGNYSGRHGLPPYLTETNFATLKDRLDRFVVVQDSLESHLSSTPPGTFDGYNLSDIFEYISADDTQRLLLEIARTARNGARLCYWNLLVPRWSQGDTATVISRNEELGAKLSLVDRGFFYQRVVVEEVIGATEFPPSPVSQR